MPPNTSLDPRHSRPYTQGAPDFETQLDGACNSTEGGSEAISERFPPRYSSHGAVASHFQAYGGETWMDFLRESGTDQAVNRQPPNDPATVSENRLQPSSSRQTLPNRPLPRTDSSSSRSSDRKRRLTTSDSPIRRPSSIRMHSNGAGNSSSDPIVLDSSPAPQRPLPPPPSPSPHANAGPVRRQSDIVLPRWQPDSDVSQCPVCGRQFTFLYRKHHCRYVLFTSSYSTLITRRARMPVLSLR